jgi:hypothetical protein
VDREATVTLTRPRLLLCITLELLVILILTAALNAQEKPKPAVEPPPHVSCVATNKSYTLEHYDKEQKKLVGVDMDDWRVTCKITVKDKVVYDQELEIPRPTEFRDAMLAIDEFRTKKAKLIIKELKK